MSHRANVYPHHDLTNLAFYHLEVIRQKERDGVEDSIALDCMSCLIALAVGTEGLVNFCGHKIVEGWKERRKYHKKLAQVCLALGVELNEEIEPFHTLAKLKELRDELAHPKPIERIGDAETRKQLHQLMEAAWDGFCNPEFVEHAYGQVHQFEQMVYQNPGVKESGILTSAFGWGRIA